MGDDGGEMSRAVDGCTVLLGKVGMRGQYIVDWESQEVFLGHMSSLCTRTNEPGS